MTTEPRRETEPHDRLTRMCDAAITAFEGHPEYREGDKCIVFLDDGTQGGLVLNGYEDDAEAMTDLLLHLRAIFRANGKDLDLLFLGPDGVDRE